MKGSPAQRLCCWSCIAVLICALQPDAPAESIPVRHMQGTVHGFLALRSKEGRVLAVGDLFQVVRGDRVTSRLLFRFKDGSVDDETAVFLRSLVKIPIFLKEKWDVRRLPRSTPLSRLAEGHRESGV